MAISQKGDVGDLTAMKTAGDRRQKSFCLILPSDQLTTQGTNPGCGEMEKFNEAFLQKACIPAPRA